MTAKDLFEAKGFTQEITEVSINYVKGDSFIRFDLNEPMYWSDMMDVSEYREAIDKQVSELWQQ